MLVIGFDQHTNSYRSRDLAVDPDTHSPKEIHDRLKRATGGSTYTLLLLIEDDTEVANYIADDDYDLSNDEDDDTPSGEDESLLDDEDDES